jgi:hypothetical protein
MLVVLAHGAVGADEPPQLGRNIQATKEDVNPTRMYSGPYLAVDPADEKHVVASYIDFGTSRCGLLRSTDGGQTWKQLAALPAPPSFPYCLATQSGNGALHSPVAFGRDHTLYYALIGWDDQDGGGGRLNTTVILARSTDLGDSWQTTLVRNNRGKVDKEVENARPVNGIAVDTKTGAKDIVYVSWSRRLPNALPPNAEPLLTTAAVSTDGGETFGEPFSLVADTFASPTLRAEAIATATTTIAPGPTPPTTVAPAGSRAAQPDQQANFGAFKSAMVVDGKGTLYAAWPPAVANMVSPPIPGYFLTKSTDQGKTWTTSRIAPFSTTLRAGAPGPAAAMRMAWTKHGGPDGTLHLVAEGTDQPTVQNLSRVFYYRSTDGGETWTEPTIINDADPASFGSQYLPNISVAPNGRVDVAWWDTRNDRGTQVNDVYYSYSTDNGDTFSPNMRITERSVDRKYGVFMNFYGMSSPPGVASTNSHAILGWDDTRFTDPEFPDSSTVGGGLQDIFTANVQHAALGAGTSNGVMAALAAAVGLLAVGLLFLVGTLVAKRRSGPAPAARPADIDAVNVHI